MGFPKATRGAYVALRQDTCANVESAGCWRAISRIRPPGSTWRSSKSTSNPAPRVRMVCIELRRGGSVRCLSDIGCNNSDPGFLQLGNARGSAARSLSPLSVLNLFQSKRSLCSCPSSTRFSQIIKLRARTSTKRCCPTILQGPTRAARASCLNMTEMPLSCHLTMTNLPRLPHRVCHGQ